MNEIQKEISEALRLLSVLSVSGDVVDVIASVKAHLRDAQRLAAAPEEAERDG